MSSRGALLALALSLLQVAVVASSVQAECRQPRRLSPTYSPTPALTATVQHLRVINDSTSAFRIVLQNTRGGWYFVKLGFPGDACWPYGPRDRLAITNEAVIPSSFLIGPGRSLTFDDVPLSDNMHLAFCNSSVVDYNANFSTEAQVVLLFNALDIIGLGLFGWQIGEQLNAFGLNDVLNRMSEMIWDALPCFARTAAELLDHLESGSWLLHPLEFKDHLVALVECTVPIRGLVIELLRQLGLDEVAQVIDETLDFVDRVAEIWEAGSNVYAAYQYTRGAVAAYRDAPTGFLGLEVAPDQVPTDPPFGYITSPAGGATVGNSVDVAGVASADPCTRMDFVNLTYCTAGPAACERGEGWQFAGQDDAPPYSVRLDLSRVADGTIVLLGWDVYDVAGHFANSPAGAVSVRKDAAALAVPADGAAFVRDVTIPDGTRVAPGQRFVKTWRLRNTGRNAWGPGYTLAFLRETNLAAVGSVALPPLAPGQEGDVTVNMTAPAAQGRYWSYWRPRNGAGSSFGPAIFALIEVVCEDVACGGCPVEDQCNDHRCSSHAPALELDRFKTPATGPDVHLASGGYRHHFSDSPCYHLFHDDFAGTKCLANEQAAALTEAPRMCRDGAFVRVTGSQQTYRLEGGRLQPLCGAWTEALFRQRWNYSPQVAVPIDATRFRDRYAATYPIGGPAQYPPGQRAPVCGDPGFECGVHDDPNDVCYGTLDCGRCRDGSECEAGRCVLHQTLVPGRFTSPAPGSVVSNLGFRVEWIPGTASDGAPTSTALSCQVDGGEWSILVGFGGDAFREMGSHRPGATVTCLLRTRLDGNPGRTVDSPPTSWQVSSDQAEFRVTSVELLPDSHPNGCDDLRFAARFRNVGNQRGTWQARAFLHPAGAAEEGPETLRAWLRPDVTLDPGEETSFTFWLRPTAPLPLIPGSWLVTVVIEDVNGSGIRAAASTPAVGADQAEPVAGLPDIEGAASVPAQVTPGTSRTVRLWGSDDYALARWELAWRTSGGLWQPVVADKPAEGVCPEQFTARVTWVIEPGLAPELDLDLRLRVTDLAGRVAEQITRARTTSNTEPQVAFRSPQGGERFHGSTLDNPTCLPVEFDFVRGEPILGMDVGVTNAARSAHLYAGSIWPIPEDGQVQRCLRPDWAGDALSAYVKITDATGREFFFYSEPFRADLSVAAPWREPVVDLTQEPWEVAGHGQSMGTYGGLTIQGDEVAVTRWDSVGWDQGADNWVQQTIRSLHFRWADFQPRPGSVLLAELAERNERAGGFTAAQEDDWLYGYRIQPLAPCTWDNLEGSCSYRISVREIVNGRPTAWQDLATYEGRLFNEQPDLRAAFLGPNGERFVAVRNAKLGQYRRSDLYRAPAAGGAWSRLVTFEGAVDSFEVLGDRLLAFRESLTDSVWTVSSFEVSMVNGQIGPEVPFMTAEGQDFGWRVVRASDRQSLFAMGIVLENGSLRLSQFRDGQWIRHPEATLSAFFRGHRVQQYSLHEILANPDGVMMKLTLSLAGAPSRRVMLPWRPGTPPDLDHSYLGLVDFYSRAVVVAPDGSLVRGWGCSWNLEPRLCLQGSVVGTQGCYDGDPCTTDHWDPVAGRCRYEPLVCPDDGNACNGLEQCDPLTGQCGNDGASPCDDGLFCNGAEQCDPASGACQAGPPPALDDGATCTQDRCDEQADLVDHIPVDDACLVGPCERGVCRPDDPLAHVTTGCLALPLAPPDDGLPCTEDRCDPATGLPSHPALPGRCALDGGCWQAGDRNPAQPCLECRPERSANRWSPTADGTVCDDGRYCTEEDRCQAGVCGGEPRDCRAVAAGEPCRTVFCDEATAQCLAVVADEGASCDDGDPCNGLDHCQAGRCVAGAAPRLDDGNPCTVDLCDPLQGVLHLYTEDPCDADGNGCTVSDRCARGVCAPGAPADCAAAETACQAGACRSQGPTTFVCEADAAAREGASCDDDDPCTLGDRCRSGVCQGLTRECDPPGPCQLPEGVTCHDEGGCQYPPAADGTPCPAGSCRAGACQAVAGDPCTAPLPLELDEPLLLELDDFVPHHPVAPPCAAGMLSGPDVWVTLPPLLRPSRVEATAGAQLDVVLVLHERCPEQASECQGVVDRGGAGGQEGLDLPAQAEQDPPLLLQLLVRPPVPAGSQLQLSRRLVGEECPAATAGCPCGPDDHCEDGLTCQVGRCERPICEPGTGGCPCRPDGSCAPPRSCVANVCQDSTCPIGTAGCACYGNGTCDEGLRCEQQVCAACPAGTEGCFCYGNQTCNSGLRCEAGSCRLCPAGTAGCPCFPNQTCFDGLVCATERCEPGSGGTDAGLGDGGAAGDTELGTDGEPGCGGCGIGGTAPLDPGWPILLLLGIGLLRRNC